ncbi:hypothetical protein L195_g054660 [Trifolium pratense]|uniref:Retrotransposon Copia-like N-terminal domain-containing protein n=1 Tax=Trifolium pratense TaxID=57577 RepID=A0A2K3KHC1_TRIPR|nr:hypothetical protein L195_g054660 [Trifolium pratense]
MPPCMALVDPIVDQSSPFFVHSSDGPSSVTVTLVLTNLNYHSWAPSTRPALGGKMKLEFINDIIVVPVDLFDHVKS